MADRHRYAGLVLLLLLGGCTSTGNRHGWWPAKERWRAALDHATSSPATWAPAAAAAAVAAGGWDQEISDWARRETPVFGSGEGARRASDELLVGAHLGMVLTVLAVPVEDHPGRSRLARLLWEETAVFAAAGVTDGLKRAAGRERPNGSGDSSFPSGHSTGAFASSAMASQNLRRSALPRSVRLGLGAGVEALAAGTAWARVEAGAHFPTDVLAGAALGRFVSVLVHDAFLDSSSPLVVSLELGTERQVVVVRIRF